MEDKKFTIYSQENVYLGGEIKEGSLHLESEVHGEYHSEKHYSFSKEETQKLFAILSLEALMDLCKNGHLPAFEQFLQQHQIQYDSHMI